jgi:tripartite-type tricarboxylate transporter receptor subunit TctC
MPPYLPLAFAAALLSAATHAQWQPARPVQMIVPNPPGGGPDFIARLLAPRLSEAAKQNVVVDNPATMASLARKPPREAPPMVHP